MRLPTAAPVLRHCGVGDGGEGVVVVVRDDVRLLLLLVDEELTELEDSGEVVGKDVVDVTAVVLNVLDEDGER